MEDCKVCKQLIKEKHRRDIWWKVFCIIFCATTIILGILYFGSGSLKKETNIDLIESTIENNGDNGDNGDNGSIIIGGDGNNVGTSLSGTMTEKDYTPIICITIIAGVAVLVAGGVIIANNIKRSS